MPFSVLCGRASPIAVRASARDARDARSLWFPRQFSASISTVVPIMDAYFSLK
jgi:hypothetical protein